MAGNTSLDLFWGEFLVSPIPLELTLNFCSHKCAFCFANLNKPHRTANVTQVMGLLAGMGERATLPARLLREGYPVLASNRVDIFAGSNYRQALPILETMTGLDVPVAFQTRGGKGIDEALGFLKPSVWYVSICQTDDAIRKSIEPGAPPLETRWELIQKLREAGHRVNLAVNPYVPAWMPDLPAVFARAKALGVDGAWIETMHLNHSQVAGLTPKEHAALGEPLVQLALKRRKPPELKTAHCEAIAAARDAGLEPFHVGMSEPSGYWQSYRDTYAKTYPTMQDLVNWAFATLEPGDMFGFEALEDVCKARLPAMDDEYPLLDYVGTKAHNLMAGSEKHPSKMTYRQLLALTWGQGKIPFSPAAASCFAYAGRYDTEEPAGWVSYADERGLPLLVFCPEGTGEWFVDPHQTQEAA